MKEGEREERGRVKRKREWGKNAGMRLHSKPITGLVPLLNIPWRFISIISFFYFLFIVWLTNLQLNLALAVIAKGDYTDYSDYTDCCENPFCPFYL